MFHMIALLVALQAAPTNNVMSVYSEVSAQSSAAPPPAVEAAEAEGARYPKADVTGEHALYGEAFGPKGRQCVDAEGHATARSGEFVAGPFEGHVMMAGAGRKVWWAPRQTGVMPPMQLRAAQVGAPGITVSWTSSSIVRNENGYFFNTTIRFPKAGKWLVVVTSGDSWGCFLLDEV